jgi:multiple sugar transport system ATP-binding protein
MNLRTAAVVPGGVQLAGVTIPLPAGAQAAAARRDHVTVGTRPESFKLAPTGSGLALTVSLVEELGADAYVYGSLPGDEPLTDRPFVVRFDGRSNPRVGDVIHVEVRDGGQHAFDRDTGARLG